jgi:hypothetical protein
MVIDVTQEDVIDYCEKWFESNCGSLVAMFVDPQYISDDSNFKDDGETYGAKRVIDISLIETMEEIMLPMNEVKAFDELESSIGPLERTLTHLHHTMLGIVKECTQGGVALRDYAI